MTPEELAELRRLEREWLTRNQPSTHDREEFARSLFRHSGSLLDTAERAARLEQALREAHEEIAQLLYGALPEAAPHLTCHSAEKLLGRITSLLAEAKP